MDKTDLSRTDKLGVNSRVLHVYLSQWETQTNNVFLWLQKNVYENYSLWQ